MRNETAFNAKSAETQRTQRNTEFSFALLCALCVSASSALREVGCQS